MLRNEKEIKAPQALKKGNYGRVENVILITKTYEVTNPFIPVIPTLEE